MGQAPSAPVPLLLISRQCLQQGDWHRRVPVPFLQERRQIGTSQRTAISKANRKARNQKGAVQRLPLFDSTPKVQMERSGNEPTTIPVPRGEPRSESGFRPPEKARLRRALFATSTQTKVGFHFCLNNQGPTGTNTSDGSSVTPTSISASADTAIRRGCKLRPLRANLRLVCTVPSGRLIHTSATP